MDKPKGQSLWQRLRQLRALTALMLLFSGSVTVPAPVVAATAGVAVVATTTAVVTVATPEKAEANVPYGYHNLQWGNALGYIVWDQCYGSPSTCYDYIYESVTPTTFDDPTFCLTTQYDWTRDVSWTELGHHYDGRFAQSCVTNGFQDIYPIYESAGAYLIGAQKEGQCLGYAFNEVNGVCQDQPNMEFSTHTMAHDVWAGTWWTYYRDGRHTYDTGGDPTSATS